MSEVATQTPFGAAKDRALANALPGGAFVSAEEKAEWHDSGLPFWLVGAMINESKDYGTRARFIVVLKPEDAANVSDENSRTLDFGWSPVREELIKELTPILASTGFIGPLYLAKLKNAKGQDVWDITDVPPSDKVPY